jgi:presenilin-like A22 family membrane protease
MKHNIKITIVLLAMFILTQFIGLYVVNSYSPTKIIDNQVINVTAPALPYGMETPEVEQEQDYIAFFYSLIIAFIIAITLLFFLTKFNAELIIKFWFFIVVAIALGITLTSFLSFYQYASIIALILVLPLAFIKIYKQNFLIHNLTELLIYPGIAAVFVPILNFKTIIILLVLISVYDMWAVWHSGIMQKMAKYQIRKLKIFSGFFVPYASKKMKAKIKELKKLPKKELEKKRIQVNVAILGGGDVVFPILASGVMLKTYGFITIANLQIPLASILVILGATLGLFSLFLFSEKKKFYPAMPFITAGIFLGMLINWVLRI